MIGSLMPLRIRSNVVEKASQNEGVGEHKYRVYDNLSRGLHRKMILPLLNLDKTEMFLISTYDTMSYGTANKYNTTLEKLKPEIDLAAQRQINYLDFWQRLAADNVKNKLFKDIVNPIWEGFYVWGHGWPGCQSATANLRTVRKSMRQSVKSMDQSVSTTVITELWLVPMLPSTTIHMIIVPRLPSSCLT